MSETAIRVDNLSKQYRIGQRKPYKTVRESIQNLFRKSADANRDSAEGRTFWALKDINFEVQQGEVVGIIGRNGAGKSTLLKVLSRITEPTAGQVETTGRVGSLLEVGTGFHPELTGRENVYLNGAILGMRRAEIAAKFDEIVAFAEIDRFLDTPVKFYSSGMYTRLAFAVAAHLEPEILIVDEVLAVGDAQFQQKCMGRMGQVAREGRTVLFVSHNLAAISNLCTRAIVLNRGKIIVDGPVSEGVTTFIRSFRGDAGIDLRDRQDRAGAGRVRFTKTHFEDEEGNVIEIGTSGKFLSIALDYESKDGRPLANVRASICVSDQVGQLMFLCSSELTTTQPINCPPKGTIRCVIPSLPLSGGEYNLMQFLEVNAEVEDSIDGAIVLPVQDGDFYGTGRLYPRGWQGKGVLLSHRWIPPAFTDPP